MSRKKTSTAGIVLGLLLLVAAVVVRWVVAPALAVLPSDFDETRNYTGQATLLQAAALASPGSTPLLLRNVPTQIEHHTKALDTKGDSAKVSDAKTVRAGGSTVAAVEHLYAVDRTDLGPGTGFSDVTKQTGLTFNWPLRTQKQDYTGWVSDTGLTTPLVYAGTAKRDNLTTYAFTTKTTPQPITDPQVLRGLPQSLPKGTLASLAPSLGLPGDRLAALAQALPQLPDPVKLSYTYQVDATYWVEPSSGVIVDVREHEVRSVALPLGGTATPVAPVMDMTITTPASTITQAGDDARTGHNAITLLYTVLPWGLGALGALLLVLGLVGRRSRRQPPTPNQPVAPRKTPVG